MRVDLLTPVVQLVPDQRGVLRFEVRNDSAIIEQIVCTIPELDASHYEVWPLALTLFPGDSGQVRIALSLPRSFPAGVHELDAHVQGRVGGQTVLQRLVVEVAPRFDMAMSVSPQQLTARKRGEYLVHLENTGNTPAEMVVRATDESNVLDLAVLPSAVVVPPASRSTLRLEASGRRPWFGSPVRHTLSVSAEHPPEDPLVRQVVLLQKARLTTGMITALTLAAIVAAWALALLFATRAAFGSETPKKTVPENFATGVDVGSLDPAQVGAALNGTVTAASNGAPLGRITVELYNAKDLFVTAVATGPDGGYRLEGVLPGRYRLRYRAPGFDERWYPDASSASGGQLVEVAPKKAVDGLDVQLPGGGGGLTATVIAGDDASVTVTVTVEAIDLPDAEPITQQVASGQAFTLTGLATPATYRITASAPSFQDAEITQALEAGKAVTANPIRLTAAAGQVSGTVVDLAGNPLGDVTVTTTVNGEPVTTLTPTAGAVGHFTLQNLPTPGTYVLEFTREGYAKVVTAIRLDAGGSAADQQIVLGSATGTVSGVVTAGGAGLGGVTIEVSGGGFSSTATSFTSNPPGSYVLTGLPVPGDYVVTFSAPGRLSASVAISVTPSAPTATADVDLLPALGRVFGRVVSESDSAIGSALVQVSDGETVKSTVSANVGNTGSFEVDGLPPGVYTIRVSDNDPDSNPATNVFEPVTYLVEVGVNPELPGVAIVIVVQLP